MNYLKSSVKKNKVIKALIVSVLCFNMFSPVKTYANNSGSQLRVLFSFDSAKGETYMYMDVIYTSNEICSGIANITFKFGNISVSYGLNDGEGVTDIGFYVPQAGYRTYQISFDNTSYFVYRFTIRDNDPSNPFWTATALSKPASSSVLDLTFSFTDHIVTIDNSTSSQHNNGLEAITRAKIALYLQSLVNNGLTIDTSNIEDLLSQIIANQNGNQQSSSTVSGNDTINSGLSDVSTDYQDFESDAISDFNDNLNELSTTNFTDTLTELTAPVNWLKTQMDSLFNSMGQFKFIPQIVLMLAIALIFIGR